jgi:hypothetical protein
MDMKQAKPLTKDELRRVVNDAAREKFGVAADRIPATTVSGSTAKSAEARRYAFVSTYVKN